MKTIEEIMELLQAGRSYPPLKFDVKLRLFFLVTGSVVDGEEVFQAGSGEITITLPELSVRQLVANTVSNQYSNGQITLTTHVSDRLGSPGSPDYDWWEHSVKQYDGTAIVNLQIKDDQLVLTHELPEHDQHEFPRR